MDVRKRKQRRIGDGEAPPKRAVIYTRVSSIEQVENFSLATQRRDCERFCDQQGLEVISVYEERGESAKTADRTELNRLLADITRANANVGYVVVYAVSRFSRQQEDHHALQALLKRSGILLRSVTEPFDESPMGRAMEGMLAVFAQLDNDVRRERTVGGMRAALAEGRWTWRAPLGYRTGTSTEPSLVPNESADGLRQAFERFASGSSSFVDAAKTMTRLGVRARDGRPISHKRVRAIFENPVYAGRVVNAGWGVDVMGDFEPLVSPATFERVRARLRGMSKVRESERDESPEFPLRRFLRCGTCGTPITAQTTKKANGATYPYYFCRNHCAGVSARTADVHEQFLGLLRERQPSPGLTKALRMIVVDVLREREGDARRDRSQLQKRIDELKGRKDVLLDKLLSGTIDNASYKAKSAQIDADIGDLRLALDAAQRGEVVAEAVLDRVLHAAANAAAMWEGFGPEQRRRFQTLVFPKGLIWLGDGFQTAETSSLFKWFGPGPKTEAEMASPPGFEPGYSP